MSNKSVFWTKTARADLEAIVNHIAADSIVNALSVLDRLEKKAESLNAQSCRGREVPELQLIGMSHYRELLVKPWRIIYRLESDHVQEAVGFRGIDLPAAGRSEEVGE